MKTLREMMDLIESAQTVSEFAPGPAQDNDDLTDEAYKDGQRLGISSVDGMTLSQAFDLARWDMKYTIPFSYGWKSGRQFKIKHALDDGVKLVLQKDGSLVRAQGMTEMDKTQSSSRDATDGMRDQEIRAWRKQQQRQGREALAATTDAVKKKLRLPPYDKDEKQLEENPVDPIRRIEELFRDKQ